MSISIKQLLGKVEPITTITDAEGNVFNVFSPNQLPEEFYLRFVDANADIQEISDRFNPYITCKTKKGSKVIDAVDSQKFAEYFLGCSVSGFPALYPEDEEATDVFVDRFVSAHQVELNYPASATGRYDLMFGNAVSPVDSNRLEKSMAPAIRAWIEAVAQMPPDHLKGLPTSLITQIFGQLKDELQKARKGEPEEETEGNG